MSGLIVSTEAGGTQLQGLLHKEERKKRNRKEAVGHFRNQERRDCRSPYIADIYTLLLLDSAAFLIKLKGQLRHVHA